jgi:PAS domain S-box-containing protein
LYQLALDKQLAPVFTVVSRQGVLEPALLVTLLFSLLFLVWGDLSHIAMVAGTSYLVSIMGLHLGLWLCRGKPEVRWPWWSLCFFAVEAVALVVGGLAWNWRDLLIGLLLPIVILTGDAAVRRIQFAPFHPQWWLRRYSQVYAKHFESKFKDFVVVQVIVLIVLVCGTTTFAWMLKDKLKVESSEPNFNLLVVLLVTLSFVAIAIACWTTLPQIAAIDEARTQAKSLFITTLDTVPDTILVLDKFGTIRQLNPAAEELFQIDSQDLIGHHLSEFFPTLTGTPQQWSNRSEHIMEQFQSLRIIESTISQPSNRRREAYVAIMRDITERKSAENEIRNALEKEKELNELKSRFISMTSHEFRTPLTTIFSSTELLQDYSAKWAEQRKQKHFQRILTAVKHMNQLLNDVLLIAQAEAGKSKCNPALLDVIHFCQDLIDELQITANSRAITFDSQSDRLHAYLDEKLLRHILSNLLSNAIKYSPEGSNVSFALNCEQGKIIFRVQDRGIGIPAADQAQLFDTFHRASNVGTISGTGLGLAIVKKAVDLQHGQITFESEVGVGTTFIVSLPLQPEDYSDQLSSALCPLPGIDN